MAGRIRMPGGECKTNTLDNAPHLFRGSRVQLVGWRAHSSGVDDAAPLQYLLAQRQVESGLHLVADGRQETIKERCRGLTVAGNERVVDIDQHFDKAEAG